MDEEFTSDIIKLYPEYHTVYGPYSRKQDDRKFVVLYDGKKRTTKTLARIKLETKLGKRLHIDETCDHKDADHSNDDISNLQVLSRQDNAAKGHTDGKCHFPIVPIENRSRNYGEENGMSKLTVDEVQQIRYMADSKTDGKKSYTQREIAEIYGCSRECISAIIRKKTWCNV